MNIFVISNNPKRNARMLDNRRLVKMVLETAQLLSNAMHFHGVTGPYKVSHANHPCSVWARLPNNYNWLLALFIELSTEYTRRYNKTHKSALLINTFQEFLKHQVVDGGPNNFTNCTPFKELPVFEAYRRTMRDKWAKDGIKAKWA